MRIKNLIFGAYQSLRQNLRRSLLTMLGIIIGISSVITILSLGQGFQIYTIENLTQSNGKNVTVDINFTPNNFEMNSKTSSFTPLDLHLVEEVEGVASAKFKRQEMTSIMQEFQFQTGKYLKTIGFNEKSQVDLLYGRNFSQEESKGKRKVAVISKETAEEISFDVKSVLGYGINIENTLYTVIGISKSEGGEELFSTEADIEIPKGTYDYYHSQDDNFSSITLSVKDDYKPSSVANEAVKKLTESGAMALQGTYSTMDMSSLLDGISKILSILTLFISGVTGISLFIAGVGVMNMMYTSVSERTQEIGVRRAMGAKRSDIRLQFLTEGLLLTLSSGVIGYIFGFLIAVVISQFLPFKVNPSFSTIGTAVGITTTLGLVFSVAPANAAARKDLIDILR